MVITTVDIVGDSESAGTIFGWAQSQGQLGGYAELTSDWLANLAPLGPLLSPGVRFVSQGLMPFPVEWSFSGSFNSVTQLTAVGATHGGTTTAFTKSGVSTLLANGVAVTPSGLVNTLGGSITNGTTYYVVNIATNTFGLAATSGGTALALGGSSDDAAVVISMPYDKVPYGYGKFGNGSSLVATWTMPSTYLPIVGFDYWWVDIVGGGNPSYSLDGGTTYTNFTETIAGDNGLKKCYIASPITRANGFKVKCSNAANTGTLAFPAGITPYWFTPQGRTNGVILNNFAANGGALRGMVGSAAGDRLAALDSVTLGSGSPISSNPTVTLMLHINDVELANSTQWGTDLSTLNTRASAVGKVGFINCWEVIPYATYNLAQQVAYRAQTKTSAAGFSPVVPVLDMYDQWNALGFPDNASQTPPFLQDGLHPNQNGNKDIARRVYAWMLANFFPTLGNVSSAYTASALQALVGYSGKRATLAYSAATPITVVPT